MRPWASCSLGAWLLRALPQTRHTLHGRSNLGHLLSCILADSVVGCEVEGFLANYEISMQYNTLFLLGVSALYLLVVVQSKGMAGLTSSAAECSETCRHHAFSERGASGVYCRMLVTRCCCLRAPKFLLGGSYGWGLKPSVERCSFAHPLPYTSSTAVHFCTAASRKWVAKRTWLSWSQSTWQAR